ncbi:hypothetical protein CerSpe_066710 [Prunus speciosa]
MSLLSNRIPREELQPGDHIYSYRIGFSHHGIYVGEGWVIHFTPTCKSVIRFSATYEPVTTSCRRCGHDPNKKGGVLKTCIDCFLKGDGLHRFEYNVFLSYFILKQDGTCSTGSCYPSDKTVRLATEIFKKDEVDGTGFGEYDLLSNNCETFASYCKTGMGLSWQVIKPVANVGFPYLRLFATVSLLSSKSFSS